MIKMIPEQIIAAYVAVNPSVVMAINTTPTNPFPGPEIVT